jgi:hypothetical protein
MPAGELAEIAARGKPFRGQKIVVFGRDRDAPFRGRWNKILRNPANGVKKISASANITNIIVDIID